MNTIALKDKNPISPIMKEVYNRLRTNIEFSGEQNKVICITSCTANDGKTTVSYNLAKSIAKNGKKVLLIDGDMRNSTMHNRMDFDKDLLGLSHCLVGKAGLKDIIYMTSFSNLYFMPTGVFPKNPSELFGTEKFSQIVASCRNAFDYVIIDTPPVRAVVDPIIIANNCDAYIIVSAAGANSRTVVKQAINDMSVAKSQFLGLAINKISSSESRYYSYSYSYGHDSKRK